MTPLADRFRIELGADLAPRNYGDGTYGSDDYGGTIVWTDLRCQVVNVAIDAGRPSGLEPAQVGRLVVTVAQWRPAGDTLLIGRTLRLLALRYDTDDPPEGVWAQAFTGTVEQADRVDTGTGADPVTLWTLTVVDATARLGWHIAGAGELDYPAEQAQPRIYRLVGFAGLTPIIDSTAQVAGQVEARTPTGPILDELRTTLEAAASIIYAAQSGELFVTGDDPWQTGTPPAQFRTVTAWAAAPSRADLADVATTGPVRWLGCPASQRITFDAARIRNRVQLTNTTGTTTVEDVASIGTYGRRDWNRSTIAVAPTTIATNIRDRYSTPAGRIVETVVDLTGRADRVTVDPDPVDIVVALTRLRVGAWVELWTPPDDTGRRYRGGSRALGYRWRITPAGAATLTLLTEALIRPED